MQIGTALVADGQATEAIEPGQRAFDHPAMPTQPLARVDASPGDARDDTALATGSTAAWVIIALIRVQLGRTSARSAPTPTRLAQRRDRIERCLQQPRIMHGGCREPYRERDASSVDHKMALRARFATIRRIRPGCFAPLLAATLAESSEARDQSSLSASARRWSSSWCKRSQTPTWCQSRNRRQHVIPLPQPSSCGSISQAIPLLSTNKIPVNTARSLMRGRPPLGLGGSVGSSGATTAHNSSLTSGLLMPPVYHRFC